MITKICTKCHTEKNISEFNKTSSHKLGMHSYCRECQKTWRIEHQKKYPWKFTHRYILTRCYNKNSDHYKGYGSKGIKNFLTVEDLKYLWFRDNAYSMKKASIDRKDPKKNYTLDNCRYLEYSANSAKSHLTYEERRESSLKALKKT